MHSIRLNAILASTEDGGIGKDNGLPWPHNKRDMEFFRSITDGGIVVMGHNTWLSLPGKLKNRVHVVLSRSLEVDGADEVIPYDDQSSTFYILDSIEEIANKHNKYDVFIIGGAKTYMDMILFTDKVYHTVIPGEYDCDTFVPLSDMLKGFSKRNSEVFDCGTKVVTYIRTDTDFYRHRLE